MLILVIVGHSCDIISVFYFVGHSCFIIFLHSQDLVEQKNELHEQLCEALVKVSSLQSALDSRLMVQGQNEDLSSKVQQLAANCKEARELLENKEKEVGLGDFGWGDFGLGDFRLGSFAEKTRPTPVSRVRHSHFE